MAGVEPAGSSDAVRDLQLKEFAASARCLVGLLDALIPAAVSALNVIGWDTGRSFSLRAELVRGAECAELAKRRSGTNFVSNW